MINEEFKEAILAILIMSPMFFIAMYFLKMKGPEEIIEKSKKSS